MSLHITWRNDSCLTLTAGDLTVITNPTPKTRVAAHVVLLSHPHDADHNAVDQIKSSSEQPTLIVDTPGEYEIQGTLIQGVPTQAHNTAFRIDIDGIRCAFLGRPTKESLSRLGELGTIDVLLLAVGDALFTEEEAAKAVSAIEPRVVIPYGYNGSISQLLNNLNASSQQPEAKTILKAHKLPADTQETIVLTPQNGA